MLAEKNRKDKASCGSNGFTSRIARSRSASPRTEKPEMPLYRYYWFLVPYISLSSNHKIRPPRSDRPHAPIHQGHQAVCLGWFAQPTNAESSLCWKSLARLKSLLGPWRGLLRHHGSQARGECRHATAERKKCQGKKKWGWSMRKDISTCVHALTMTKEEPGTPRGNSAAIVSLGSAKTYIINTLCIFWLLIPR